MARRAKGTGYLITNADGTKTLRQTVTDPRTGKEKRIQVTADTETACNRLMRARLKELDQLSEIIYASPQMTVTQLCSNYLQYKYSQGLIKRTSRDRDEVTINNQIADSTLGRLQIATVTSKDIDDYFTRLLSEKRLSVSSIEKAKYILDSAFKWAIGRKELPSNPLDPVRASLNSRFSALKAKEADDEDVNILTSEEKVKVWKIASTKWSNGKYRYTGGLSFKFIVETGIRVGEWIAFRWADYDFENHILKINKCRHQVKKEDGEFEEMEVNYITTEGSTKNSKARNIELSSKAVEIIEEIYRLSSCTEPTDYICLNQVNKNHTATSLEHVVNTLYEKAGIIDHASGLHVLRRTFATELFDKGYSVKEVAAYLGDEEATVSKHYIAARKTKEINGKRIAIVALRREKRLN